MSGADTLLAGHGISPGTVPVLATLAERLGTIRAADPNWQAGWLVSKTTHGAPTFWVPQSEGDKRRNRALGVALAAYLISKQDGSFILTRDDEGAQAWRTLGNALTMPATAFRDAWAKTQDVWVLARTFARAGRDPGPSRSPGPARILGVGAP